MRHITKQHLRCDTCMYWVRISQYADGEGQCRRLPPTVPDGANQYRTTFPHTAAADYCGMHASYMRGDDD